MPERKQPLTVAQHNEKFGGVASFRREPARKTTTITSAERHLVARALKVRRELFKAKTVEQRVALLNSLPHRPNWPPLRKLLGEWGVSLKVRG